MDPRPVLMGGGDGLGERVEGAGVQVARLEHHDGGALATARERRSEGVCAQAALLVDRDDLGRAQAEVAQRQVDGVVALGADQHPDPGTAVEPPLGDVPAGPAQDGVPARSQPGEVGHRRARREPHSAADRKAEEVDEPGAGHVLDRAVGRSQPAQARVLVPRADEPVGGEGGGVGPPDDEAEEPARRHGGEPGVTGLDEQVEDLGGVGGPVRELGAEGLGHLLDGRLWGDCPAIQRRQPLERMVVRPVERGRVLIHPCSVLRAVITHQMPTAQSCGSTETEVMAARFGAMLAR